MKMRFRFTIAKKLALGFGLLTIAVLSVSTLTYRTLDENLKENEVIVNIYRPSETRLNDLYTLISTSKMLIKNWVFIEKKNDTPDKIKLKETHSINYPQIKNQLENYVDRWGKKEKVLYEDISHSIDTLFEMHKSIMGQLNSFESYVNVMTIFQLQPRVEEDGDVIQLTDKILAQLDGLLKVQVEVVNAANKKMKKSFADFQQSILTMGIFLFVIILMTAVATTRALVQPINTLKLIILDMGKGILPRKRIRIASDEIGEMGVAVNLLAESLKKTSEFALEIGEGNFDGAFEPLSKEDVLGNSLIIARDNLRQAAEDESQRKKENDQRSWSAQGLAQFSEILRKKTDNIEEFSAMIISNLVNYLDANQGGLFVLNDNDENDKFLELTAFYAYSRRKYLQKRIEIGENLIGQTAIEGETTYMTDLPDNYVHITSGLGHDNPKSLLIVPLKLNEKIYGVVELASFKPIEQYQIDFVKKIGESIASTISTVKINLKTNELLKESNQKSKMLAKREEDVRLSMKKVKIATANLKKREKIEQEKFSELEEEFKETRKVLNEQLILAKTELRKEKNKYDSFIGALNTSVGLYELNMKGDYLNVNERFLELSELSIEYVQGRNLREFIPERILRSKAYKALWLGLSRGRVHTGGHQYFFAEKEKWFYEIFVPLQNEKGEYEKVLVWANDISKVREQEIELKKQIEFHRNL